MNTYTTNGRKPVKALTLAEAALLFANRTARERYGRRGDCRSVQIGSYSVDNSIGEFSAFIGRTVGNRTNGHNIQFTVRKSMPFGGDRVAD